MNIEQKTITSMEVAEMVGKDHKNILRDIKGYVSELGELKIEHTEFFMESEYITKQKKKAPCYDVTLKGCEFISNKLTGIKGTGFTAKYINKFHDMAEAIHKPMSALERIKLTQDAVIEVSEKVEAINTDLQNFKQDLPLLGVDMDEIKATKNGVVVPMMGGKDSNAYNNKSLRKRVYIDMESQIRREFGVSTYKAIKRNQVELAKELIKSYELPMCLKNEIEQENAQMRLDI